MEVSELSTEPRLMTVSECADWLHVSKTTLYGLIREGLPFYALGDKRFNPEAVMRWLESRKVSAQ